MTEPAAAAPDLSGALLSRSYALVRLVGRGGMAAVYEARSEKRAGPIAVKLLADEYVGDREIVARFLAEGEACLRLVHPNIVRVFEVATAEDGTPYIVMELLQGVPLSAYTRGGGKVPLEQAAVIIQGVLAGLAAAHAQGIVHRDLKPENVVLAREPDGRFVPKVLDFGIARVMDAAGGMGRKTKTGMLLGTPAYMSPEQIRNAKEVDARSDVWAAGVLLYEMLTGRVAFPAPTEYARLAAVLTHEPVPIEGTDPGLAAIGAVVLRAMRKDREERFPSALDMARAVAQACGGGASQALLTKLPSVASVLVPSGSVPPIAAGSIAPSTPVATAQPASPRDVAPPVGPSGTLASLRGHVAAREAPAPPVVVVRPSGGGTLPSEGLPMLRFDDGRRRVPVVVVVALVLVAFVAGAVAGAYGVYRWLR